MSFSLVVCHFQVELCWANQKNLSNEKMNIELMTLVGIGWVVIELIEMSGVELAAVLVETEKATDI